jgi:glycosyltransferase involved in cell wall biosynthesis
MIEKLELGFDQTPPNKKIIYSPLWYDSGLRSQSDNLTALSDEIVGLDLRKHFVITYSGNLGSSHPIDDLILAADYFVSASVLFLVIGSGERVTDLKEMSESRDNVVCLNPLDQASFDFVLEHTDVGVTCLSESFSDISIPSKTFNLMAKGKPILAVAALSSELANLVRRYNAGVVVRPKNPAQIFQALQPIIQSAARYRELAANSKRASADYSPNNADIIAKHFLQKKMTC